MTQPAAQPTRVLVPGFVRFAPGTPTLRATHQTHPKLGFRGTLIVVPPGKRVAAMRAAKAPMPGMKDTFLVTLLDAKGPAPLACELEHVHEEEKQTIRLGKKLGKGADGKPMVTTNEIEATKRKLVKVIATSVEFPDVKAEGPDAATAERNLRAALEAKREEKKSEPSPPSSGDASPQASGDARQGAPNEHPQEPSPEPANDTVIRHG